MLIKIKLLFFVCMFFSLLEDATAQSLSINTDGSTANPSSILDAGAPAPSTTGA